MKLLPSSFLRRFRRKDLPPATLRPVDSRGGWWPILRESFAGAWQQGVEVNADSVRANSAVYSVVSLIASDVSKMRLRLVEKTSAGIWQEVEDAALSPLLRKPNHFQTRIKFVENWVTSKLFAGNTYVLKVRDNRGVVVKLFILDPSRVKPLVAPDGSIFYELSNDNLSGLTEATIRVPAREIIHDVMVPLFHPLVGVSPIYACGLAATQGLRIQTNSARFFGNGARPSGVLTAPGAISTETAARLKDHWEQNYGGENYGKVAVLGDGLAFAPMSVTAEDSQLIEQLRWTGETVCSCFHVPTYMVNIGAPPSYNNIEALNQQYYSQCLQGLIESIEACLDEGLELQAGRGCEFDIQDLLRMDTATAVKAAAESIQAGFLSPDEARARFDLPPVPGGDTPYLQQQNFSLAALAKRDAGSDPFKSSSTAPASAPAPAADNTVREMLLIGRIADLEKKQHETVAHLNRVLKLVTTNARAAAAKAPPAKPKAQSKGKTPVVYETATVRGKARAKAHAKSKRAA